MTTDRSANTGFDRDYPKEAPKYPREAAERMRDIEGLARQAMVNPDHAFPKTKEYRAVPVHDVDVGEAANDGTVEPAITKERAVG